MAGENFIKGAIKHPGAFRKQAEAAGKSTAEYAKEKEHAPGKTGQRARLAETLMHLSKSRGGKKTSTSHPVLAELKAHRKG